MKRSVLGGALLIAFVFGLLGAETYNRSSAVYAQTDTCTTKGTRMPTSDGTLVCDCVGAAKDCSCITAGPCPPLAD